MKKIIICLIVGFILGLILGLYIYNFYIATHPEASDTEKGLVGIIVLFCAFSGAFLGYEYGKDSDP